MNIKDCEGCVMSVNVYHYVKCIWFHKNLICPCSTCLVKVMCNDTCDLLEEHTERVENENLRFSLFEN